MEDQLEYFGKTMKDDIADALEVAVWNKSTPSDVSYDFFNDVKQSTEGVITTVDEWDFRTA